MTVFVVDGRMDSSVRARSESGCSPGPMCTWWTWKFGMTFTNWALKFFGLVECDRCTNWVEGFLPDDNGMSAGVYVGWTKFMDFGEFIVCDECMQKDERYLAVYPSYKPA